MPHQYGINNGEKYINYRPVFCRLDAPSAVQHQYDAEHKKPYRRAHYEKRLQFYPFHRGHTGAYPLKPDHQDNSYNQVKESRDKKIKGTLTARDTACPIAIGRHCILIKLMYKGGRRKQNARILIRQSPHDTVCKRHRWLDDWC